MNIYIYIYICVCGNGVLEIAHTNVVKKYICSTHHITPFHCVLFNCLFVFRYMFIGMVLVYRIVCCVYSVLFFLYWIITCIYNILIWLLLIECNTQ